MGDLTEPVAWCASKPSHGTLDWERIRIGRTAYFDRPLYGAPPSPTLPSRDDAARVIYAAMGFAYEGRSVDFDGNPYGSWKTACDAASAILALFTAPDDTKQAGSYNRGGEDCTEVQARKPMPLDTVEGER